MRAFVYSWLCAKLCFSFENNRNRILNGACLCSFSNINAKSERQPDSANMGLMYFSLPGHFVKTAEPHGCFLCAFGGVRCVDDDWRVCV